MTYRADPITQRDGSALASSNCRMASIATGIDYETAGRTTSTGATMRARQPDQSGGTDSGDAEIAWQSYGADLAIHDGDTFSDAVAALKAGKLVHLDVWHASVGGPCLSGSGAYGHTMAVAPESSGTRWLVADPWCSPPKWLWTEESKLRAGAEEWGRRCYSKASADPEWPSGGPRLRRIILRRIVRELMSRHHPGAEDPDRETGGSSGGPILFTTTNQPGGTDVAIQAAAGATSSYRCDVAAGLDFYEDAGLSRRLGEIGKATTLAYMGAAIGAPSRAVIVGSSGAYSDGVARPTIVYIPDGACVPYGVPPPEPAPDPDTDAAVAARDAEWREFLLAGSPGSEDGE